MYQLLLVLTEERATSCIVENYMLVVYRSKEKEKKFMIYSHPSLSNVHIFKL